MGERFGQFEIERPLGVGGMAETAAAVRRGQDGFEQHVCLKRILPAFCRDAEFVRAFQNEAKLAVRLVHPHICRIYDFGNHEGTWWMSMELVELGDLRSLFDKLHRAQQPLPIDLVLQLAIDLASALHHAHTLRIDGKHAELVHRDISPSNVLIDGAGHFKLADFGIAKASLSGEGGTRTGTVKGKVPYMSPEHARGQKIDGRADLWSFGVVLYEALAGRRPFRGAHDIETMFALAEGRYDPIEVAAPHTPPVLAKVIAGLLERDLDKRIARAADVLDMLASSPPPANARLRLVDLAQRIDEPKAKARQALGEAPTDQAAASATKASDAPATQLGKGGVSLAPAPEPASAPPDAPTRTAAASIPAMPTVQLEAKSPATDREVAVPTGVREARAVDEAIARASASEMAAAAPPERDGHSGPTPFVANEHLERRRPAPAGGWALIAGGSALVALVGIALSAWGLGLFDAAPAPEVAAAVSSPPSVSSLPSASTPRPVAEPAPAVVGTPREGPAEMETPELAPVAAEEVAAVEPAALGVLPGAVETPAGDEAGADDDEEEEAPDESPGRGASTRAARTARLVIGVVGFGSVWVDGRRVAESTDHVERRVRPGRHTVAAGIGSPHETRTVEVDDGGSVEVLLHAR